MLNLAMPFWESAGKEAYDYSGYNMIGELKGTSLPTWKGDYVDFGGGSNNARIDLGTPAHLLFTTQDFCGESMCLWRSTGGNIITRGRYGYDGWMYSGHQSKFTFFIYDGDSNIHQFQVGSTSIDTWYHVFWGKTGNILYQHVYADGKLVASGSENITNGIMTTPKKLLLGIYYDEASDELDGNIKFLNFWPKYLSDTQRQQRVNNPFGMFEPIRRPALWSVPSGGTINFSGTSGIQTSTKGAALAVNRPLSGTSALASATTSAIFAVLRALSGTSAVQSSTTSAILALIRALDGTSGGTTQTSSPILSILRAFSGTSTLQSATSDAILAIARALVGTSAIQSSTSDAEMTIEGLITFLGTAAGATQTKDAILAVARDLSGTSSGQSTVTDAILAILRPLVGTAAAQSATTDAALEILRSLSGTSAGQSSTTDAAITLLRSLAGTAAVSSATSEAILAILRELEGSADMASATSDAIMALAALGILVDTILESLTPVRTVESLTPVRTVESI